MWRKIGFPIIPLLLLVGGGIRGLARGESTQEIVRNAPAASAYPQAGALILLDDTKVLLTDEGSTTQRHLLVKLFKKRGIEKWGDIKQRYDRSHQEVKIDVARTFKPDSSIVEPPSDAISDVSAPEVQWASAYSNAMMKVVSFAGLEPGSVIDYRWEVRSKKKGGGLFSKLFGWLKGKQKNDFWTGTKFQSTDPILRKSFTLDAPADFKFKPTVINGEINPQKREEGKRVVYTWRVENEGQIIEEPNMPPLEQIAPRLLLTTFGDWGEVAKWFAKKFYPQAVPTGQVKREVTALTAGDRTESEKIRDIFLFVVKEIRTVYLPLGQAGYRPNPASRVLENRYGDYRDKAVLLVSLLKGAGIEAYPAFVNHSQVEIDEDLPSPGQFNDLIVAVPQANGGYLWLDPAAETAAWGYLPPEEQGAKALVVKPEGGEVVEIPLFSPEENKSLTLTKLSLAPDGSLSGLVVDELKGFIDQRARSALKDKTPQELEKFFQEAANRISQGTELLSDSLTDLKDLKTPVQVRLAFRSSSYAILEGKMMLFEVPSNPLSFFDVFPTLPFRKYDMLIPSPLSLEERAVIDIPSGYRVAHLPEEMKIDRSVGEFSLSCQQKGRKVLYTRKLTLKVKKVGRGRYRALKQMFDKLAKPQTRLIILERETA